MGPICEFSAAVLALSFCFVLACLLLCSHILAVKNQKEVGEVGITLHQEVGKGK